MSILEYNPRGMNFSFTVEAENGAARAGRMQTPHGEALTPMFMPVGTRATIKTLSTEDIESIHPQVVLANTYHLFLRPGHKLVSELGGVHEFMHYRHPMLTDSGGFQVFSLGEQVKQKGDDQKLKPARISEEGVEFSSHLDGARLLLTPELSIEIQQHLGADIIMAFDECMPDTCTFAYGQESLARTHRWGERCIAAWEAKQRLSEQGKYQALFGIVQGAQHQPLREAAARWASEMPFDGIAVGGETIGYNMPATVEVMSWIRELLPAGKPRYAMGLGRDPQNLIDAVVAGFDMFDCVGPTRLARNGALYHGELSVRDGVWRWESEFANGRLPIGNARFAKDTHVILPGCDCFTCSQGYTRAYLHHLARHEELSYYRLASLHNVRLMVRLTEQLRTLI